LVLGANAYALVAETALAFGVGSPMVRWIDFWNSETTIYVNARHRAAHYRQIAEGIVRHVPSREAYVLDYGCGRALSAALVAEACAQLYLCDGAESVRTALREQFGRRGDVRVLAPDEMSGIPDGSIDLLVVNSVVQYLTMDEFRDALRVWRGKLSSDGTLVLADIIPPGRGALADAAALLNFAARNGFLIAAGAGLVRTFFSDYRRVRSRLGIQMFEDAGMIELLKNCGFAARRHYPNLGHNAGRMAFVATRSNSVKDSVNNLSRNSPQPVPI
jgi:SAM-dependent methyltransferase